MEPRCQMGLLENDLLVLIRSVQVDFAGQAAIYPDFSRAGSPGTPVAAGQPLDAGALEVNCCCGGFPTAVVHITFTGLPIPGAPPVAGINDPTVIILVDSCCQCGYSLRHRLPIAGNGWRPVNRR